MGAPSTVASDQATGAVVQDRNHQHRPLGWRPPCQAIRFPHRRKAVASGSSPLCQSVVVKPSTFPFGYTPTDLPPFSGKRGIT